MYELKVQQYNASVTAMYSKYTPEYNPQFGLLHILYIATCFEYVSACVGGSAKGVGIWLGGMGVGDELGMSVHCTYTLP